MGNFIKTLIVVNLIASLAFCFVSLVLYANKMEWKKKFLDEKQQYDDSKKEWSETYEKLKEQYVNLQTNFDGITREKDAVAADLDKTRQDVQDRDKTINELKASISKKDDTIGEKENVIKDLNKKNEQLIADNTRFNQEAELAKNNESEATTELVRLQTVANQFKLQIESLKKSNNKANEEIEEKTFILDKLKERLGRPVEEILVDAETVPVAPITAKVLASMAESNLVVLSVGEKDKVKVGYKFTVYRDNNYIGKVEVIELHPNMCSARILVELNNDKGLKMERGDDAKTKLQ